MVNKLKLDKADLWLIDEISNGLRDRFGIKKSDAQKLIMESNFMRLLHSMPEQVHHDSPSSWVDFISRQMNFKEMAY